MSPALPSRDGTIRLAGTITNTSTITLSRLQAVLWRSLDPIQDTEGMERALTSEANEPLGSRVKPGTIFQNVPSEADRTLAPGESTDFDLVADIEDFELPEEDAVYLVGVQIRGQVEAGGDDEIVGRGRILMPLVDQPEPRSAARPGAVPRVQVTSVVLLASRPSLVRAGVLNDDHLADELSGTGRLRSLLIAAQQPSASFAVDPALIEELETMRRGYTILGDDGKTSPGTGQAAAARWLQDFTRLARSGDGYRVLYGNPDLTALVEDGQQNIIDLSRAAGADVESTRALPLLILPGGGRINATTMTAAEGTNPKAILLSENSARGPGPLLAGTGGVPVVSYSPTALSGGPGPSPRRTAVKIRQRSLADTWLAARASEGDPAAVVRLITTPAQAASMLGAEGVPWIDPTTLTRLLAGTPAGWDEQYRYGTKAQDAELSPAELDEVRRLSESFAAYTDLLVDAERAKLQQRSTLPRAASIQWRDARKGFLAYTGAIGEGLDDVLRDDISIVVTPKVLTTGRAATFPITVRNGLAASPDDPALNAVRVVVRFRSVNSQRLTVAPVELQGPLAAGTSRTENAQVRAETNGSVQVTAELFTRSGRPLGKPVPILVDATQAGTTGWIIAIAAGVVLVGTTALRIRQVTKGGGTSGAAAEPVLVSRPAVDQTDPSVAEPAKDRDPLDV